MEALEIEVRKLAERIDFTRAAGVDPATIANMERGLADLREAWARSRRRKAWSVSTRPSATCRARSIRWPRLAGSRKFAAARSRDRRLARHRLACRLQRHACGLAEEMRGLSAKVDRVAIAAIGPDRLQRRTAQSGRARNLGDRTRLCGTDLRAIRPAKPFMAGGQEPEAMDHLQRDLVRTQDSLEAVHSDARPSGRSSRHDRRRHCAPTPRCRRRRPVITPVLPHSRAFPPHPGANGRARPPPAGPMAVAQDSAPPMPAPPVSASTTGAARRWSRPRRKRPRPARCPCQPLFRRRRTRPSRGSGTESPSAGCARAATDRSGPAAGLPARARLGHAARAPAGSAAERIAASEAALGGAKPGERQSSGPDQFHRGRPPCGAGCAARASAPDAPPQAGPAKTPTSRPSR